MTLDVAAWLTVAAVFSCAVYLWMARYDSDHDDWPPLRDGWLDRVDESDDVRHWVNRGD